FRTALKEQELARGGPCLKDGRAARRQRTTGRMSGPVVDTRTSYSAGFVPATNAAEPYWASTKGPNSLNRRARKNTSTTLSCEREYTVCGLARSSLTEL